MTDRCELCGNRTVRNWLRTTDLLGETGIFILNKNTYFSVCIECCLSNIEFASEISATDARQIMTQ